jgi:hypothetical protein
MTAVEPNAPETVGAVDFLGSDTSRDQTVAPPSVGDPSATLAPPEAGPNGSSTELDALITEQISEGNGGARAPEVRPLAPPIPGPAPLPLPFRVASGRYRSPAAGFQLELRVDVDGRRPLRMVSGDYFATSGATTTYFGSWTVDAVTVSTSPTALTVVGTARTTWQTTFTVATVTVPRRRLFQPAAPATIRWSTPSGAQGATYVCAWESGSFRTVELEQDQESGVTPFTAYPTGSLPSGGPARTLSAAGAYAEAGVQMLDTGGTNTITTPSGFLWTDASLHNAMQSHFSKWQERPQFKVWLLHAMRHELGIGLRGIMFDQQGLQRQGCASFYQAISSPQPANQREQLYVNVHELGHCFNLFHSFHKAFMTPPLPNRPGALSWMNYPQNYAPGGGTPGGAAAFWAAFPFQFDDLELAHVRHGFRNAVIMGGNPFGTGAALEVGDDYADQVADTSGLRLMISPAEERVTLGTPVVLNIALIVERTQQVHRREQLHPKYGIVQVAISRPRGDIVAHRPPVQHCQDPDLIVTGASDVQPISAYIGYDATVGQVFSDPGVYRIRASYAAPDGSLILSDVATLRVGAPRSEAEDQVADLMLGDQTGMVLTLLGTDSAHLAEGTAALETVLDEHSDSTSAVYAKLALGMNAARPFIDVDADGRTRSLRDRDLDRADELLNSAIAASRGSGGLDDLTVYQAAPYLAGSHEAEGDGRGARTVRRDARQMAEERGAPTAVLASLTDDETSS